MRNVVLVLSNSEDGEHTDSVLEKLRQLDQSTFRFDVDELSAGKNGIAFSADHDRFECLFQSPAGRLSSAEVASIWYRRPNAFRFPIEDPIQRSMAEQELESFLEGLWLSLKDVFWVSNPHSLECARKKVFQLQVARALGFSIPPTIITNEPEEVRRFYEAHRGRVIYKTLKQGFVDYGDRSYNIPTTLLTSEHLKNLELVRRVPCLFQRYVEKRCDLRVTVVGRSLFAVRIDSQEYPEARVDWRHPATLSKLRHTLVTLENDLAQRCFDIVAELGLNFGAIDLAVDQTGEAIFLEINPNGQWYWLEHLAGAAISEAIAETLISQTPTERR